MPRSLKPGENPFRESNPVNAQRRKELMDGRRTRLDELERHMNQRYARLQAERQRGRD